MKTAAFLLACAPLLAQADPCAWTDPGADPFTGNAAQAILSEPSLPLWVRPLLVLQRLAGPTDHLQIWNDSVTGKDRSHRYSEIIRGMRFGKNRRCETLSRPWPFLSSQPADAWCIASYCYALPDICKNPSFIRRYPRPVTAPAGGFSVPEPSTGLLAILALAFLLHRYNKGP